MFVKAEPVRGDSKPNPSSRKGGEAEKQAASFGATMITELNGERESKAVARGVSEAEQMGSGDVAKKTSTSGDQPVTRQKTDGGNAHDPSASSPAGVVRGHLEKGSAQGEASAGVSVATKSQIKGSTKGASVPHAMASMASAPAGGGKAQDSVGAQGDAVSSSQGGRGTPGVTTSKSGVSPFASEGGVAQAAPLGEKLPSGHSGGPQGDGVARGELPQSESAGAVAGRVPATRATTVAGDAMPGSQSGGAAVALRSSVHSPQTAAANHNAEARGEGHVAQGQGETVSGAKEGALKSDVPELFAGSGTASNNQRETSGAATRSNEQGNSVAEAVKANQPLSGSAIKVGRGVAMPHGSGQPGRVSNAEQKQIEAEAAASASVPQSGVGGVVTQKAAGRSADPGNIARTGIAAATPMGGGQGSRSSRFHGDMQHDRQDRFERSERFSLSGGSTSVDGVSEVAQFRGEVAAALNRVSNQMDSVTAETEALRSFVEKLGGRVRGLVEQDGGQIRVELKPEGLGRVMLNCRVQGDQIGLEIIADNRAVRSLLSEQGDALREMLNRQGFGLQGFDVRTRDDGRREHSGSRQGQQEISGGAAVKGVESAVGEAEAVDAAAIMRSRHAGVWMVA